MRAIPSPDHSRLIRKLETIAVLSEAEKEGIESLPLAIRSYPAGVEIIREGDVPDSCCLLLDGFVHRYKSLPEGGRQVLCFHVPGDIPDLQSLFLKRMDHSLGTVVPSRVAFIRHKAVLDLIDGFPGIALALWRDTLIDAAVFREWIVSLGRRSGNQRLAHLFCELYTRLGAVGIATQDGYLLPLTQSEIGDATGLSTVHVNRMMQDLRARGLIASDGRFLRILDWPGLKRAGNFDPLYLHLEPQRGG